ncbi:hypothetical protein [Burkholderia gladioli]|uniref:hypothetical protein n=1 Tax=Burkholderia gladioli TaxID=28095 RepID=UPI001641AE97|nr:hypothetical protein [Burkholderia gladioli]MBU9426460.1 hypothetical protein [Burkholderia gladioli]MDN8063421.1 hypothetical protein [Burkholderia gladioli]
MHDIHPEPARFWLHIPITAPRGDLLGPTGADVSVLGKRARLHTHPPAPNLLASAGTTAVQQWLLFDPMPEVDAQDVFREFCARLPALSLRMSGAFRIGWSGTLNKVDTRFYNGPIPTLIPAELRPSAIWGEVSVRQEKRGWEIWLDKCSAVEDPRLIAALALYVSAKNDVMARSQFLTYLTILDSLAPAWLRPPSAHKWIKRRLQDPAVRADESLKSALENLRKVSHGRAVRELVERAARAKGLPPRAIAAMKKTAGELYGVRSNLSHAGNTDVPDVKTARDLVELVLDQAVLDPSILDVRDEQDARRRVGPRPPRRPARREAVTLPRSEYGHQASPQAKPKTKRKAKKQPGRRP